jgi:hypothetical protein
MDRKSNQLQWRQRVAAFERSGLSRDAWCVAQGLKVCTLDYWRKRLQARTKMERKAASQSLLPIVVRSGEPEAASATTVVLILRSGVRLSAPAGVGATWLACLLREIGAC